MQTRASSVKRRMAQGGESQPQDKRACIANTIERELCTSKNPICRLSRIIATAFDNGFMITTTQNNTFPAHGFTDTFIDYFCQVSDDNLIDSGSEECLELLKNYKKLLKIYKTVRDQSTCKLPPSHFNRLIYITTFRVNQFWGPSGPTGRELRGGRNPPPPLSQISWLRARPE